MTFPMVMYTLSLLVLAGAMFILYRNDKVFTYRGKIINKISELTRAEIEAKKQQNLFWRYDEFQKVSYDEMVYHFWRPLNSFYAGYDFNIE